MLMKNSEFGKMAEELAARVLEDRGYRVLERNVNFREGEIDLICERRGKLLFVEVKARRNENFGAVGEWLTHLKIARLKKAVYRWRMDTGDRREGHLYFVGILFRGGKALKVQGNLIE